MSEETFEIAAARAAFPALVDPDPQIYFDNAGGTQVLSTVSHAVKKYLESSNVQLGASYQVATESTKIQTEGKDAAAKFLNAAPEEIVIGPSTTQLFANLSQALHFPDGGEIIISRIDHEANIASWVRLARFQNLTIKWWEPSAPPHDLTLTSQNLRPLLSEKTKLVTCTHTSNILGTIHDVKSIAEEVHKVPEAMLCVDGVAFAPHQEVDVKELGVDFYSFSWYKVYGPHISTLYASTSAQQHLTSLGHYFHPNNSLSWKLGLAASSYELVAAIPSILSYLGPKPKETWRVIAAQEERLQAIILEYLNSREDVTIYGEKSADRHKRVPVISFSVRGKSSKEMVERAEKVSKLGFRWGHFYSKRLVDEILGLGEEGVVRASLVHYNTEEEAREWVRVVDGVLKEM